MDEAEAALMTQTSSAKDGGISRLDGGRTLPNRDGIWFGVDKEGLTTGLAFSCHVR